MRRATWWLLVLALVSACDGAGADRPVQDGQPARPEAPALTGGTSLVALRPVAGAEASAEVLLSLRATDDPESWSIEARGFGVERVGGRPVLRLGGGRASGPIRLVRQLDIDPAQGSRLRAWVAFDGQGALIAEWLRDGEVVAQSEPVALTPGESLVPVDLDLPPGADQVGPCDAVVLRCDGGHRRLDVAGLDIRRPSLLGRLPADGSWVVRDGVARPVQALVAGRPLTARMVLRPGHSLHVAATRAEGLAPGEHATDVSVTLSWDGVSQEVGSPLGDGWLEHTISSPKIQAGLQEVDVTLVAKDGACLVGPLRSAVPSTSPSTVVLITSADHRGDHLGAAFRGVHVDTPALDALAARGLLFEDCQVSTNTLEGSLAALFTGTPARDLGLLTPGATFDGRVATLASGFRRAGWETLAALGGSDVGPDSGLLVGFDEARVVTEGTRRPAAAVIQQAQELLGERAGRPVFLWVHLSDGSWPHAPQPATFDTYIDLEDDPRFPRFRALPKSVARTMPLPDQDIRDMDWLRARYKAVLTELDAALAPFLASPRVASATVAFVGTTGLSLGDPESWFKRMGLHPGVLHVPLVLAGPGLPEGLRRTEPVSHLDLGRTLLDRVRMGGVPLPGRDLMGDRAARPLRFAVEAFGFAASVTGEEHHLITALRDRNLPYLLGRRQRGERELYRRTRLDQPGESLTTTDGDKLKELSRSLVRWLSEAEPFTPAPARALSDEERGHLAALGYTQPLPEVPRDPWSVDGE